MNGCCHLENWLGFLKRGLKGLLCTALQVVHRKTSGDIIYIDLFSLCGNTAQTSKVTFSKSQSLKPDLTHLKYPRPSPFPPEHLLSRAPWQALCQCLSGLINCRVTAKRGTGSQYYI